MSEQFDHTNSRIDDESEVNQSNVLNAVCRDDLDVQDEHGKNRSEDSLSIQAANADHHLKNIAHDATSVVDSRLDDEESKSLMRIHEGDDFFVTSSSLSTSSAASSSSSSSTSSTPAPSLLLHNKNNMEETSSVKVLEQSTVDVHGVAVPNELEQYDNTLLSSQSSSNAAAVDTSRHSAIGLRSPIVHRVYPSSSPPSSSSISPSPSSSSTSPASSSERITAMSENSSLLPRHDSENDDNNGGSSSGNTDLMRTVQFSSSSPSSSSSSSPSSSSSLSPSSSPSSLLLPHPNQRRRRFPFFNLFYSFPFSNHHNIDNDNDSVDIRSNPQNSSPPHNSSPPNSFPPNNRTRNRSHHSRYQYQRGICLIALGGVAAAIFVMMFSAYFQVICQRYLGLSPQACFIQPVSSSIIIDPPHTRLVFPPDRLALFTGAALDINTNSNSNTDEDSDDDDSTSASVVSASVAAAAAAAAAAAEEMGLPLELPILIAVLGQVFDVTKGRQHYGPGQPYAHFAG